MLITIDVPDPTAPRIVGRAGRLGLEEREPFSGAMELLAVIEELCRRQAVTAPGSGS